jgi:hypothetical protein
LYDISGLGTGSPYSSALFIDRESQLETDLTTMFTYANANNIAVAVPLATCSIGITSNITNSTYHTVTEFTRIEAVRTQWWNPTVKAFVESQGGIPVNLDEYLCEPYPLSSFESWITGSSGYFDGQNVLYGDAIKATSEPCLGDPIFMAVSFNNSCTPGTDCDVGASEPTWKCGKGSITIDDDINWENLGKNANLYFQLISANDSGDGMHMSSLGYSKAAKGIVNAMSNKPASNFVEITGGTQNNITDFTDTIVELDTVVTDSQNWFDTTNYTFNPTTPGRRTISSLVKLVNVPHGAFAFLKFYKDKRTIRDKPIAKCLGATESYSAMVTQNISVGGADSITDNVPFSHGLKNVLGNAVTPKSVSCTTTVINESCAVTAKNSNTFTVRISDEAGGVGTSPQTIYWEAIRDETGVSGFDGGLVLSATVTIDFDGNEDYIFMCVNSSDGVVTDNIDISSSSFVVDGK